MRRPEIASLLTALAAHAPTDMPTGGSGSEGSATWLQWVKARDAAVRARVVRAEEDSLAYLLVYGTSFTKAPRVTRAFITEAGTRAAAQKTTAAAVERVVGGAIDTRVIDLVAAARSPGDDERLQWVRGTFDRLGLRIDTPAGVNRARAYLLENFARVTQESRDLGNALAEGQSGGAGADVARRAHLFAARALASDTSWPIAFGVHDTLADLRSSGTLAQRRVRRVAVVGPGLDLIDKAEGYDYYPPQTLQPVAIIDSLLTLGLASPPDLRLMTFDVSSRVNEHIRRLADRGRSVPYNLQLTLDPTVPWTTHARSWWRGVCARACGIPAAPLVPPGTAGALERRAVRVSPDVLHFLTAVDLDIVYQRAELAPAERFDLIVATNILIYYDTFEQALAAANIAAMLEPDGMLLTNDWLGDDERLPLRQASERAVRFSDRPGDGERMRVYRAK